MFGALAVAMLKGTRTNLSWLTGEADKARITQARDCATTTALAQKRLTLRGCGTMVSDAPDGSNGIPGAPADGSCSLYRPNGGGAKRCDTIASGPTLPDPVAGACGASPSIGQICSDASIFIGTANGKPIYMPGFDQGSGTWNGKWASPFPTTGAGSTDDGRANTAILATLDDAASPYAAAKLCHDLVLAGHDDWYLPARDELDLMLVSKAIIPIGSGNYWSSTESDAQNAWLINMGSGSRSPVGKVWWSSTRCVRRD